MPSPVVTINQGSLVGSVATDYYGQSFFSFQGIPYAKPPLGKLRFKAPQPPDKWAGTFDATKEGSACYSRHMLHQHIIGSEDCLILNVHTNKISAKLRPVMFWIHGGGFAFGSSSTDLYGPDFLVHEDVVLVSINYRFGLLGFLSFEDPSLGVPGNAAFKDMVMALTWVQNNISQFGGDPNNVTIFGESAGGASVHLLVLSSMCKGLFHKAIAQSGCALNPWVCQSRDAVRHIADMLNIPESNEKAIYDHLMQISVEEILKIQDKIPGVQSYFACQQRTIGLTIESGLHEPAFLNKYPIEIIEKGEFNKIPFILGYTTAEGMVFDRFKNPTEHIRPTVEDCIPWGFGYKHGSLESKMIAEELKEFYYGHEEPSSKNIGKKYDMLGDCMFLYGIFTSITKQFGVCQSPIYMYRMSLETELNFFKKFMGISAPGTAHLDDCGYLFKNFMTPAMEYGSKEDIAVRRFVKLWTNFARFGTPSPEEDDLLNVKWGPVTDKNLTFLEIGEDLTIMSNPEQQQMDFWKCLFANSPTGKIRNKSQM